MSDASQMRTALRVAFRHYADTETTEAERDAILVVTMDHVGGAEGELASRMLHHRQQEAEHAKAEAALQLDLALLFETQRPTNGNGSSNGGGGS